MTDPTETLRSTGEVVAGRFRIRQLLGAGGMGCVYEAEHVHLKRRVALKFLRRGERGEEGLERFEQEARAAGALDNEHVVQVLDFGYTEAGAPYLAMELLEGQSVGALLRDGPLPIARACDLVAQACRGLHDAHEAGLVHRDLKPENLFVCRRADGRDLLKVLDFGVVQVRKQGSPHQVLDDSWGTPAYMSPEQAAGALTLDRRSDVYALGAVLFELITGRRAFDGETAEATITKILTSDPPRLDEFRARVPAALARLVAQAMARQPHRRFATTLEMEAALQPFATVAARSPVPQAARADVDTARSSVTAPAVREPPRRRRTFAVAASAALATMAAGSLVWVASERAGRENTKSNPTATEAPPQPGAPPPAPRQAPSPPQTPSVVAPQGSPAADAPLREGSSLPRPQRAPDTAQGRPLPSRERARAAGDAPASLLQPHVAHPDDEQHDSHLPRQPKFERKNPYEPEP